MDDFDTAQALIARLPGLGPRSARRILLTLIENRATMLGPLIDALRRIEERLVACPECGNVDLQAPCRVCTDPRRDAGLLCVVARVADLWAIERGRLFPGRYHVLGGLLSALDGIGPERLDLGGLLRRLPGVREVVLALDATLEGQTTAHWLADRLAPSGVRISQLAHGVPVGGELDHLDDGTLAHALRLRRPL
ncbi:MAG: recombination mediator RecR [Sphingomonadaceae bacterium]|uniref:recombination mediator RecR n=1 Tax=Thermaurantiacus sp. TaxID=2820283 RepID=UPI00298EFF20|nr:recombination mediator RecR [Thermaurantiacus sp.]MCS6986465.1 recombination mediator RecR [Sphingomonadaceae bacterium]MDW8414274.1 recombination mediator RecR [Thermaurantiacus sp.]